MLSPVVSTKASAGKVLAHLAYILLFVSLALSVPTSALGQASGALIVIGAIGAWRYSWAAINFVRAAWYNLVDYPRFKREAEATYAAQPVRAHAFFLVTTYKIEPAVTSRVYASIFEAAAQSEGGSTIVASVVDGADVRLIRSVFASMPVDMSSVDLVVDQIAGTGKRDALATALRLIARRAPSHRDIVLFVDGDSCVPLDVVARSAAFFTRADVGALTTDEDVEIDDTPLFRDWFDLRFTQRQMMMSSMGVSRRVLTLTGRMSVIRADLATDPGFIRQVQSDYIDHWRLGRVNFLTGDDKSTWYWLLSRGYEMVYLPDVRSLSMETQPKPGFVGSASTLMVRWFGNMLRTNGRALELPVSRIGFFTWWSILDQRLSMWTTLAGPIGVLLTAILVEPLILPAYIAWVMFTRYAFCLALSLFRGRIGFPITYPPLLYFGQIFGAMVKSYVLFRLDRQRWTRQSSAGGGRKLAMGERLKMASSAYVHVLTLSWLVLGVLFLTGLI